MGKMLFKGNDLVLRRLFLLQMFSVILFPSANSNHCFVVNSPLYSSFQIAGKVSMTDYIFDWKDTLR